MASHIQIHRRGKDDRIDAGMLYLPVTLLRAVPEDATFEAEFHDDGILFRFVGREPRRPYGGPKETGPLTAPRWAEDSEVRA